ncbi:MAG: stage II sporulation protein M [Thermaerobacter sp.]|nr:stage II sporulation protein M [Thermaerobacter sp.]
MVVPGPNRWVELLVGRYIAQLYLAVAALAVGMIFGALAVSTLTAVDKQSLAAYIHSFLQLEAARPTWHGVFRSALAANLKTLGLLYLLGVSVAGMPLVLVLLFFRGFVLGFSVGFLVSQLHLPGIGLSVVAIGLQNLFLVPALAIAGAGALAFSWQLVSPARRTAPHAVLEGFAAFTGLVLALSGVVLVGTLLESYAVPLLLHMLGSWLSRVPR